MAFNSTCMTKMVGDALMCGWVNTITRTVDWNHGVDLLDRCLEQSEQYSSSKIGIGKPAAFKPVF